MASEQKMSRMQLTAMVVGGMVGAGIFSLPRTFAGATGASLNGQWRLRVADDTAGSTGTIQCVTLRIQTSAGPGSRKPPRTKRYSMAVW